MESSSTLMVTIQMKSDKNTYIFTMPYGAPLGEAYDAAHSILQEIIKFSQQAAEQAKQKATDVTN
jgi:hypothetical protein